MALTQMAQCCPASVIQHSGRPVTTMLAVIYNITSHLHCCQVQRPILHNEVFVLPATGTEPVAHDSSSSSSSGSGGGGNDGSTATPVTATAAAAGMSGNLTQPAASAVMASMRQQQQQQLEAVGN